MSLDSSSDSVDVTKQKVGLYATRENCLEAAQALPKEFKWTAGYLIGVQAQINAFCVLAEK